MLDSVVKTLEQSVTFLVGSIESGSYPAIVLLMTIESSFIPLPSEIVMIPAGYLAYQGHMDIWLAIISGVIGSILGALVNYVLAMFVGRPFLLRYGRYFLIPPAKLAYVDRFFSRHGEITTFIGRLIPGVRHLISIPAGLVRMDLSSFIIYTALGSTLWMIILTWFGYWVGSQEMVWQEAWKLHKVEITLGLAVACGLLIGGYLLKSRISNGFSPIQRISTKTNS